MLNGVFSYGLIHVGPKYIYRQHLTFTESAQIKEKKRKKNNKMFQLLQIPLEARHKTTLVYGILISFSLWINNLSKYNFCFTVLAPKLALEHLNNTKVITADFSNL